MINNPMEGMDDYRSFVARTAENSTRFAQAFTKFETNGWGEVAFEECFVFGLTFIEEPFVSYGCSVDGDTLVDSRFPRTSGGAYRWQQNNKGFYLGAWCYVTVETQSAFVLTDEVEPNYDLTHHFMFSGMAMKDLPAYLAED
jgi:hypothetical protein